MTRTFVSGDGPALTVTRNRLGVSLDGHESIPITAQEVAEFSATELLTWPGFGLKCLEDVDIWLSRAGLGPLKDTPPTVEEKELALLARLKAKYEQ